MSTHSFLTFNPELESFSGVETLIDEKKVVSTEENETSDSVSSQLTPGVLPLERKWKVWEQIEGETTTRDYTDNMKPIATFASVQEFWELWDLLPQPSQLMSDKRMVRECTDGKTQMVDALMLFREEVRPMWEDPLNAIGGHFEIRYPFTHDKKEQARIDEHWNNIILGMIGATLEPEEMITGARLVDKLHAPGRGGMGFLRIEIWYTDIGIADGRVQLKNNVEKIMMTKLDGSRDTCRINIVFKSHNKSR